MQLKHLFLTLTLLLNLLLASFAQDPTLLEHGGGVRTVEFSPVNASLIASAGDSHIIKLWNLKNDTVRTLRGHTGIVNSVAFSPHGELLASVSDDRTIKLWNVRNQQNIATLQEETQFRTVAFSPDGKLLATGGWLHVKLWDVGRRREIATLQHDQYVQTVAFSSDGEFLAVGDARESSGTVKVWNIQERRVIATLQEDLVVVRAVTFSSDDRYLASSHYNGEVKVWNVSDWERLYTIPQAGDYDIAFSPDGKMIVGTGNGYVSILWAEEGTRAARLPGPIGWMHPVDFSHDGTFLAVGAEDGIIRIWRIDTSSVDGGEEDTVQILHIDTYLQQLPKANFANGDNIPEPVPPPAVVRDFFELDPYYEQWINVGGLPVIASAKVNPYAVKEAAWFILKMIGHRPDVLRAMVLSKARFSVIPYTEVIIEIPEYHIDPRPAFLVFRERGWGGTEGATISASEEGILSYPGSYGGTYSGWIHEFAHGIHLLGFNTLDPTFDERLQITYESAMRKGLWQGTYAASDRREYWAEASHAWFHPKGAGSFDLFGNTRRALKQYDPDLATLLAEVYGDKDWQYTPVETRTHQSHLQGFNPKDSPTFDGWPELAALYRQLRTDPSSDGGGKWVNLKQYSPNQLSRLARLSVPEGTTTMVFVNFTQADVLLYEVTSAGTERYWSRCAPGRTRVRPTRINKIWLIKDLDGRNIAVFQAEEKIGRAVIGTAINRRDHPVQEDVSRSGSRPQVLITQSQRPPMYWIDAETATLYRLIDSKVENFIPEIKNATSLAVDTANNFIYWTEQVGRVRGNIKRANLDGSNVQKLATLNSVPRSIAVDTMRSKLYWTNLRGQIQRANLNGKQIRKLIKNLDSPENIIVDVARGKLYWTESSEVIRRANLNGKSIKNIASDLEKISGITILGNKIYWTEQVKKNKGNIKRANLNGSNLHTLAILRSVPANIASDSVGKKLYWTDTGGNIRRVNLNGKKIKNVVSGLIAPADFVLGSLGAMTAAAPMNNPHVAPQTTMPSDTDLLANYPNPFNPETWIPYQLSEPAEVEVHIYAVDGTLIRTLALGYQPVGIYHTKTHAVYWDGKNEVGEQVASGVYFYTLTVGEFTATRKMLILK